MEEALKIRRAGYANRKFRPRANPWKLIVAAVVECLADRIHAQRAHADALIFFTLGDCLVAVDVTLVPHFPRAIVDHPLPALLAAHRDDDDGAVVMLDIKTLRPRCCLMPKRRPAARVPIISINECGQAERQPDKQHIGSRNIAQEPAASG